jgi:hypothetical protein
MIAKQEGTLAPGLVPRPFPGETTISYASRLEAMLGMDPGYLWSMARAQARRFGPGKSADEGIHLRLRTICERMTGFSTGTLVPDPSKKRAWHACKECAGGLTVQLDSGDGHLVCQEHKRWIGPTVVDNGTPTASDLPMAASLLFLLTNPGLTKRLFDPGITFRQAYGILSEAITGELPKAGWAIIDQAWLLLRPAFVWFRTAKLGEKGAAPFEPQLMPRVVVKSATYPLEPMGRYMDCLKTRDRGDDQWWSDCFTVRQADPQAAALLMCSNGHAQRNSRAHARRFKAEAFHCTICTGQRVVPGLNSLGDVMPVLAIEWDYPVNGDLTPFMVSTGSNRQVGWVCGNGHHYLAYITNRTLQGSGCRICADVRPGINDLASTNPELAALWDDTANGLLMPTDISAWNKTVKVHLRCIKGHTFIRTPVDLLRSRGRCPTCVGHILVPGANDLATVRPDIAAWWHPTLNGDLTPDMVKRGSDLEVWWQCDDGHAFLARVNYRCKQKKRTCPVDTGRMLLIGTNDLATKEPALAKDWDRERNGFSPSEVVPGTKPYAWTCKNGHTQHTSVGNRRRARGCTNCAPAERVARGQP